MFSLEFASSMQRLGAAVEQRNDSLVGVEQLLDRCSFGQFHLTICDCDACFEVLATEVFLVII